MSISPVPEPSTSEILQRRLVGLLVLLLFVFLLSMLLRGLAGRPTGPEAGLQTVVIPLSRSERPPVANSEFQAAAGAEGEPIINPTPNPEPAAAEPPRPIETPMATKPPATVAGWPKRATAGPAKPEVRVKRPTAAATARWFVVLGTFSDAANAKALALRARQSGFSAETIPTRTAAGLLTRVRAGPFKSESEGQGARATLIVEGMTNAKLVKEP